MQPLSLRSGWCWVFGVVVALFGGHAPAADAQNPNDPIRIIDVRVGFPQGNPFDCFKYGAWAPVFVEIGGREIKTGAGASVYVLDNDFEGILTVRTEDDQGHLTSYTLPRKVVLRRDGKDGKAAFLTYIKMGNHDDVDVLVEGKLGDKPVRLNFRYPDRLANNRGILGTHPGSRLILTLGRARGLETESERQAREVDDIRSRFNPHQEVVVATQLAVAQLPDRWFGYEGVETVILPTGGEWGSSVAQALGNDPERRRALIQWVEMGGHLVVAVGANANLVANKSSFPLEPFLPARIDATSPIPTLSLDGLRGFIDKAVPPQNRHVRDTGVKPLRTDLVRMVPRANGIPLVLEPDLKVPSAVHAPLGLGRITLLGFDIDQGAFLTWDNRYDFWKAVLKLPLGDTAKVDQNPWARQSYLESRDTVGMLAQGLESFGEVPVVSFTYVALFILIYVLLIGPVDYFVLKRFFKRLELTWITFPLIVLAVSVAAYWAATYIKGDELRINKVDVLDIELDRRAITGNTWFTLFSPKLQNYTLGVEPVAPGGKPEVSTISWLARPATFGRGDRGAGLSFFQRAYAYRDDAAKIEDIPIQVWATRSFGSRWLATLDPTQPLLKADLKVKQMVVTGSLTWTLALPLKEVKLIYRENVWDLPDLVPNQAVVVGDEFRTIRQNFAPYPAKSSVIAGKVASDYGSAISQILFFKLLHQKSTGAGDISNDLVKHLDQSDRREFGEVMLLGSLPEEYGSAAELNQRVLLGSRLNPFDPPPKGTLRQNTYLRIIVPVSRSDN